MSKINDLKPILVIGHSNITADFACMKLAKTDLKVGRTYSMTLEELMTGQNENDDDDGQEEYLIPGFNPHQFSTYKQAVNKFISIYSRKPVLSDKNDRSHLYKIETEIINEHDVICVTASTAASARMKTTFKAVVFDEAAQLLDPDLLISITKGAERIVLVGDHQQLAPILLSKTTVSGGYSTTLPVRLMLNGIKPHMLLVQYRMHPEIAEFSNKKFYFGKLKNGVSKEDRTHPNLTFPWPNPQIPMLFWNIQSREELSRDSKSFINRREAECIAQILDFMKQNNVNALSIGIITPYSGQQYYLIDNLSTLCEVANESFTSNIEISSVDAFQGREKDFIIYSCVRSNDMKEIGFLRDEKRLNVSITRAKYGLIVLGNAKTFSKNELWCNFIQSFVDKGIFMEGSFGHFTPSSFTPDFNKEKKSEDKDNESDGSDDEEEEDNDYVY